MPSGHTASRETFIQENLLNLGKNSESLWHLSHDVFQFHTPPPPHQLHLTEALFSTSVAKKTGLPFLPAPSLGAIVSPQEHLLSPLAQYCKSSILDGQEDCAALSHPAPTQRVEEALPQAQQPKNTGPSIIPPQLAHRMEDPH